MYASLPTKTDALRSASCPGLLLRLPHQAGHLIVSHSRHLSNQSGLSFQAMEALKKNLSAKHFAPLTGLLVQARTSFSYSTDTRLVRSPTSKL